MTDPTRTKALRTRFVTDVGGRFRRTRGLVRTTVGYQNDALRLKSQLADPRETFETSSRPRLIEAFMRWFKEVLRDEVLEPKPVAIVGRGGHWTADYIRRAYGKGWRHGSERLNEAGGDVDVPQVAAVFDLPVPQSQLKQLYTRTYRNLENITRDMADDIRETLTEGLDEGVNPNVMARRMTQRIESMTNTRARVLARTEIINSHSTATLDRYEEFGVDTVSHGEWHTAGDDRVCPICQSLDGKEYTISEMRTGTFEYDADEDEPDSLSGEYRLQPPAHPNGRCTILPSLT